MPMLRLAHISDLHYFDSVRVPLRRLAGKRLTGYLNLALNRRFQHSAALTRLMLDAAREAGADHVAITGDLTNLSLGAEFSGVRRLLAESGFDASQVTVIPGNHDRYTGGAERTRRAEGYLSPYMTSDIGEGGASFPIVRLRDGVAIIGLNTALSLPPMLAGGRVDVAQGARLEALLGHPELRDRFPVFLLHHPPYRHPRPTLHFMEGLRDWRRLLGIVPGRSALFLHGHLHKALYKEIEMDGRTFVVSGISSSSFTLNGPGTKLAASFNLIELDEGGVRTVRRHTLNAARNAFDAREIARETFARVRV